MPLYSTNMPNRVAKCHFFHVKELDRVNCADSAYFITETCKPLIEKWCDCYAFLIVSEEKSQLTK